VELGSCDIDNNYGAPVARASDYLKSLAKDIGYNACDVFQQHTEYTKNGTVTLSTSAVCKGICDMTMFDQERRSLVYDNMKQYETKKESMRPKKSEYQQTQTTGAFEKYLAWTKANPKAEPGCCRSKRGLMDGSVCGKATTCGDSNYCDEHECINDGCSNAAKGSSCFCNSHRPKRRSLVCLSKKGGLEDGTVCGKDTKGCCRSKRGLMDGTTCGKDTTSDTSIYCDQHECEKGGCSKAKQGDTRFCNSHHPNALKKRKIAPPQQYAPPPQQYAPPPWQYAPHPQYAPHQYV
jgi:hypothetical protein